ncbi:MAG: hypothetical protein WCE51_01420 [Chthoniobacterales bacterium]
MHSSYWSPVRFVLLSLLLVLASVPNESLGQSRSSPLNEVVLEQIKQMPTGGRYSASRIATVRLQSAVHFEAGRFVIQPDAASPSYCSGATYLVFLKTIEALRDRGELQLNPETIESLLIRGQRDGEGIWGRWNANGPGTARLFYELGLGRNFDDFDQAQPGDFMKIFWSEEVGRAEHGHSVIYLGMEKRSGRDYVRYWSSNIPSGYGERSVLRTRIVRAIFSRLSAPSNLSRIEQVPRLDPYLASLERVRSSYAEAKEKCGM